MIATNLIVSSQFSAGPTHGVSIWCPVSCTICLWRLPLNPDPWLCWVPVAVCTRFRGSLLRSHLKPCGNQVFIFLSSECHQFAKFWFYLPSFILIRFDHLQVLFYYSDWVVSQMHYTINFWCNIIMLKGKCKRILQFFRQHLEEQQRLLEDGGREMRLSVILQGGSPSTDSKCSKQ